MFWFCPSGSIPVNWTSIVQLLHSRPLTNEWNLIPRQQCDSFGQNWLCTWGAVTTWHRKKLYIYTTHLQCPFETKMHTYPREIHIIFKLVIESHSLFHAMYFLCPLSYVSYWIIQTTVPWENLGNDQAPNGAWGNIGAPCCRYGEYVETKTYKSI